MQKCLVKLNEVATSLIKLSPYDGETLSCPGLAQYMLQVFPHTDWSQVLRYTDNGMLCVISVTYYVDSNNVERFWFKIKFHLTNMENGTSIISCA